MVKTFENYINRNNEEVEGAGYLQSLEEIATSARKIREHIQPDEDLEAWVQDKITIAHHNMEAILGYYRSKKGEGPQLPGEKTSMVLSNS